MNGTASSISRAAPWAEPFSALYWRIRVQSYLLALAFVAVASLGYWLYRLGHDATALVYVVAPDGEAVAVLDRDANRQPTPAEAGFVAEQFVRRLYGFNSSTVHEDAAAAINMCSAAMGEQLRRELADAQFVETIRRRGIRSELHLDDVRVVEHNRHYARVAVAGSTQVFPVTDYEGAPLEVKPFNLDLVLGVVRRNPETRLNGLEIVRIARHAGAAPDRSDGGALDARRAAMNGAQSADAGGGE